MDSHDTLEFSRAEVLAQASLRALEKKYFSEIEPVSAIEIVDDPSMASCYLPESRSIRLNFAVARFARLAQFLILHELAHHKLAMKNPEYVENPYGEAFLEETRGLFKRGAYDKLL